mmetsp:Transcript_37225/g.48132  ORF Transcript_37225/g.48132 Transcript_37225/m.48132 type:complete len:995 (-) Transcript_37225:640-3624(-)
MAWIVAIWQFLLIGAALLGPAQGRYPDDIIEWQSAWPKIDGPGYGGENGMFTSPFIYKSIPDSELWSFTITGNVRSGVVVDAEGRMYVAATASGSDSFPYVYCVDISTSAPYYIWFESLDTTGATIFGTPFLGYEDDTLVMYVAASAAGSATESDNTYIYAFAANSSTTTQENKRTDLLWTYPNTVSAAFSNLGGITGAGVMHRNGSVMFGTEAAGDVNYGGKNGVVCIKRGELMWHFETDDAVSSNLITDSGEGGKCCDYVYFVAGQDEATTAKLYAVDVETGVEVWSYSMAATTSDIVTAPPSFGAHGDIIVPFGGNIFSVNKTSGAENWIYTLSSSDSIESGIAVHETNYYVGTLGGKFARLVAKTPAGVSKEVVISSAYGQIKSSPLIFGDGTGVFQVDGTGLAIAWKANGNTELWRYDYADTLSDRRQPMITAQGEILLGIDNAVVAIGGSGGCVAGYATTDLEEIDADHLNFCTVCGSGNYSGRVGTQSCDRCGLGKWSVNEGATFCYRCEQEEWCPGGDKCAIGSEGTMCAQCVKDYYRLFTSCEECPKNPFVYTLAVVGGVILFIVIYMHFTRGTKFAYEVNKDDVVAIYVDNGNFCDRCSAKMTCGFMGSKPKRVECKVTRVIDDYSMEVFGNFGNKFHVKNTPFWLIKCRVYGDEIRKQGSGRVSVAPPKHLLSADNKAQLAANEKEGVLEQENQDAGVGLSALSGLMKSDGLDEGGNDDRTILYGKSQSVGTEVIMAASLIMVGYAQSSSVFVDIPIGWPYFFVSVFGFLGDFMTFDLSSLAISPDCDWHWSYRRKWFSAMILPLVLGVMLIIQYYAYGAMVSHILIRKQYQNKTINTGCILMVLLYVFVTAKTIEPYACTTWEDGSTTLNGDPNHSCTWTNSAGKFTSYAGMALLGMFFFIFYGVGIPALLFSMLYKAKSEHTMGSVMTKEKFGWIYIRFTYEFYFWEIMIMFRKFLFVFVILLATSPRLALTWCLVNDSPY